MKIPAKDYVNELKKLEIDLSTLMSSWPSGPSFDAAKTHADAMLPFIAGQKAALQGATTQLNPVNPIKLRVELEQLIDLIPNNKEKLHFKTYEVMLDSLINGE